MKKPKLIKRGEIPPPTKVTTATINKTVTVVKDWLNTRHQNTKTNAREAFAHLFSQPPCPEC
jgi:hypothetical protein